MVRRGVSQPPPCGGRTSPLCEALSEPGVLVAGRSAGPRNRLESGMHRRVVVAGIGLAALAATGVAVTAAQASPDAHARTIASGVTDQVAPSITVVERAVSDTVVDIGPSGDSRGDLLAFANPVFDGAYSKRVG